LPTTAQRLALRVVGADDQPVVAARLSITDPHPERGNIRKLADYRSGEDGTVRIAGLPPDLDLVLAVTHDHHAPAVLAGRAGSLPSTVRLDAGLALGGRLLDPEARPVSGAEVVVRFWLSDQVPVTLSRRAVSDDEGRWRVAALPAGRVELVVQPKDHAPSSRVLELPRQASEVARITLAQPAIIAVRVVDDLGEPVANAGLSTGTATVSQTDSDGRVQIHAMSDRPLHVSASAPGHLATESDLVPPLPPDLELVLGRSFQIAGRLMDDQGSPVATGNVRIAIGRSIQDAELSPGGGFELDVPPGKPVQLHLLSSHTRELVVDVAPGFAGERRDLGDLTAPVGWAIRGRLLRASDLLPVVGARIWTPRASEKGPLMAWFLRDLLEARSGEEGDFELAGLPPLPTTLRIEAYGLALRRVEVAPGEEASPLELGDILLERGATVSVLAPGAGDGSVARLDVGGRNLPMDFLLAPVEEERAEIPGVPPGSARLSLLAGEEVLCEREVVVGEGEDLVETRCEATPLRVTGRVEMANVPTGPGRLIWGRERLGEPQLPEAVMTFRAGGISQLHTFAARDASVVVQVDADGAFVTSSLRPGRWDVQWMPDEGPSPEPRIVVIGDLEEQEVLLRFAGYAIRGRVIDGEGRPVGGAHVLDHVSRSFDLSAEDGRFGLAVPSGGAHVLQARLHETASSMVEVIVDPEREPELVELVLGEESPEDSLEVRVWSDEELPAPGALVLIELDGSGLRVLTTDSEGIARTILSPPHPPRWRAAALAGTRWVLGDWSESARSMPERDELQLGATGSLVVSADGRSGAVSVATPDGWQVDMLLRWIGASPVVSPERPLTIVGLPVGRYTVSLPPAAVTAEIKEGRTAEVTFR
jgi:protocatechuate 3,4-dioxygenase beta subunit